MVGDSTLAQAAATLMNALVTVVPRDTDTRDVHDVT
jgi:hypothetical protein